MPQLVSPLDFSIGKFRMDHGKYGMIGESETMRDLYSAIERISPTHSNVLIMGQSGTGKELVARAIYSIYSRRNGKPERGTPFITVNSASIPDDLLESTLFGYEKGAFTGAVKPTPGRFELAHGGILYLDEIGDLNLRHQAKILRAVEEGEVSRLGSGFIKKVDVRLISATNKDLERMIEMGQFREDLFYRINVIPLKTPDLYVRKGDIRLLAEYFMMDLSRENKKTKRLDQNAYAVLDAQGWKGNVRDLFNSLERAFVLCPDNIIDANYLNGLLLGNASKATDQAALSAEYLKDRISHVGDVVTRLEEIGNQLLSLRK